MTRPTRGTAPNWRNRIVGYDQVSVEAIQANPKNHRLHPEAQRRALSGVLDEVGIVQNVIINRTTGRLVDELTASTWVMNRENVVGLIEMFDAGQLKKFSILTGEFFKRRCPAVVNLLIDEIQKRGQRYIASPNHTKIALFEAPPDYIVIEGSANWTSNPRIEQTVINNNRDLLEFHKRWMQKVLEGGIWRGRKARPAKRP